MTSKKNNMFAASRFVLPEHKEMYLEYMEEEKYVPRPVLEEDELAEINYRIIDSQQYGYPVSVRWWQPIKGELGEYCETRGLVQRIDPVTMVLKITNSDGSQAIDLECIVAVNA